MANDWPTPPSDYPDDDDLACGCAQPAAMVALGVFLGVALTAGWVARTAWGITRDRCGQVHRGVR